MLFFFFFKQKTAYEMRISDWSSDVCSSDLHTGLAFLGMTLTVNQPVFAGDTIHVECEVTAARPTSKPGRGIVTALNNVVNQNGEIALAYTATRKIGRAPCRERVCQYV